MTANVDRMTLEQQIGQLLIAGFQGTTVSPEIAELIQRRHIGGIILFARNIREPQQTLELTSRLQALAKDAGHPYPLLIAVDQENGVVRRLGQGATVFPGSMAVAATGSPELEYAIAHATARELRALGINMNLAPVLDVNNNPANPVIGVRSFGEDPQMVADYGVAAIQGYQDAGVISCAKHFPGHGDTITDSHLALPVIPHTLERLEAVELVPFKAAIAQGVDSIMMGHPAFPHLMDSQNTPATISPRMVRELLRTQMGYDGVVTTDDMEMRAITETVGTERGVVLALQAGNDLAFVSHRHDRQTGALDAVRAAVASGELPEEVVRQAVGRVLRLKMRRLSWERVEGERTPLSVGAEERQRLAERGYARSVTLVRDDRRLLPLRLAPQQRTLVLYPLRESLTGVEDNRFPEGFMAASIRRRHPNTEALPVSLRPDADERERLASHAATADVVVVATMNANLYPEQAELVRRLLQDGRAVIGIAVRNPYDLLAFPDLPTYLATYEYTPGAVEAAASALYGEIAPVGRLPVSLPELYARGWGEEEPTRTDPPIASASLVVSACASPSRATISAKTTQSHGASAPPPTQMSIGGRNEMSTPHGDHSTRYVVLTAHTLYTPEEIPGPLSIVFDGPKIHAIWRGADAREARQRAHAAQLGPSTAFIDLGSLRLAPGYIDLHTHGFHGHDITTGSHQDVEAMAAELPSTGTTAFLPTIATTGRNETAEQARQCVEAAERQPDASAEILGIRLEGPFISRAKKGAQYAPAIRPPDPDELRELAAASAGRIRLVDYAPEEDAGDRLLAALVALGIVPCVGHTSATYEQTIHAIDGGARHCTHLFNAMPPLEHRAAGAPGALLTDHRATVEIIADGIHLSHAILKLVVAARGSGSVALITDAISAAGLPDGAYEFVKRKVTVSGGAVRLEDGTIAGSALTMERAVRNMVTLAGCSWPDAIRMATLTPARIAGVDSRKGRLAPGADADVVAMDSDGVIQRVWTRGHMAYQHIPED